MLADTSDIRAFGAALHRHADDLAAVATDLAAARASSDVFGSVGSRFVAALNDALSREAHRASELADRLTAGNSSAGAAAYGYESTEHHVGQSISVLGV